MAPNSIQTLSAHTIRTLSMDAVQKANSGHPGMPMGTADMAYVLFKRFLKHNPQNPDWFNRDRFILSAGHGSMLLYSMLHLTGYDVSLDDLKQFRQWGSITPGHPEVGLTPGVETTTGPLGQGFATGLGMAMAEAFLAATFNKPGFKIVDHFTYGIVSDGDLMEGISHESASLAGHLKLGKLIYLYDSNKISIDGSTDITFTENVKRRFESYDWQVLEADGHKQTEVEEAISEAKSELSRPSLIICTTHIGFGSPNKQDSSASHGAPLGDEEIKLAKKFYGVNSEKVFEIPDEVRTHFADDISRLSDAEKEWNSLLNSYKARFPRECEKFEKAVKGEWLPEAEPAFPEFPADEKGMASRKASGTVLNAIADFFPTMIGGSADLAGSNLTDLNGKGTFSHDNYSGRNIHFGVREHAMAAALNGMALHGGLKPFGGTFFVFTDYMRPSIRLAGLMKTPSIFVLTHDSIGLGEDGPTHQPIEHLASLRAMPNVTCIRPCDANEVSEAWKFALSNTSGPTLLILTRQNIPTLDRSKCAPAFHLSKGAYVLSPSVKSVPDGILIATGSEVSLALRAKELLSEKNIDVSVVNMPSEELFLKQSLEYQSSVFPDAATKRISIEAGSTYGWHRWVGTRGAAIGIDHFGESAPAEILYEKFGLTPERIVSTFLSL